MALLEVRGGGGVWGQISAKMDYQRIDLDFSLMFLQLTHNTAIQIIARKKYYSFKGIVQQILSVVDTMLK